MVAYENISHYFRFPFEKFSAASDAFLVTIDGEKNRFSSDELIVQLQREDHADDDASESFQMNFTLSSHLSIPDLSWIAPGTMGPYSWIPTMQCSHHVQSLRHDFQGSLRINDREYTNVSGRGYIEKDWGHSFPSMWIWGQANYWKDLPSTSTASLFFSFALIPWYFKLQFPGFLVVFEHNRVFYRFNTYLQSILHDLAVNTTTNEVSFDVYDLLFEHKLHVSTHSKSLANLDGAMLYGPRGEGMVKFVKEILDRNLIFDVRLSKLTVDSTKANAAENDPFLQHGYTEEVLFDQQAENVALEVTGNTSWLTEQFTNTHGNHYPWQFSVMRLAVQSYRSIVATFLGFLPQQ